MDTAHWALVIGLLSLLIATGGLVWNVWQKFIFPKPRVDVSFMLMFVVGSEPKRRFLILTFTNFGPGDVVIDCAVARPKMPWFRPAKSYGMLNPIANLDRPDDPTGPFGGGLPKKLSHGEQHVLYFPYVPDMFLTDPLDRIGIHDSFRRFHWAPSRDFRKVLDQHRRDFPTERF